jgi:hypothetical protein
MILPWLFFAVLIFRCCAGCHTLIDADTTLRHAISAISITTFAISPFRRHYHFRFVKAITFKASLFVTFSLLADAFASLSPLACLHFAS